MDAKMGSAAREVLLSTVFAPPLNTRKTMLSRGRDKHSPHPFASLLCVGRVLWKMWTALMHSLWKLWIEHMPNSKEKKVTPACRGDAARRGRRTQLPDVWR